MPQNDSASGVVATAYDRFSYWENEREIDENKPLSMEEVCEKLYQAEKEIKAGMTADARQSLEELRNKYSL